VYVKVMTIEIATNVVKERLASVTSLLVTERTSTIYVLEMQRFLPTFVMAISLVTVIPVDK
jgi:hypothetical protein